MTTPKANLLVIRSTDMHRAVLFYDELGLDFELHSHGGPAHYSAESHGFVFEIYPLGDQQAVNVRLGFAVENVDRLVARLAQKLAVQVIASPGESPWGRRAVVKDFDGNTVELTNQGN